jgi:hypothetical protein
VTSPDESKARELDEAEVSKRDWLVLPLLGLLTVCVLAGFLEAVAWRTLRRSGTSGEACMVFDDPSIGARGIPHSVCQEKIPEGIPTEYRFNSDGYRNDVDLTPKSAGTFRIVMVGTSVAAGFRVPREQTFAALLPAELSRRTGSRIELYNEGLPWRSPHAIGAHFNEVLAAKPDMILWILAPVDIESTSWGATDNVDVAHLTPIAKLKYYLRTAFAAKPMAASMAAIFSHTRSAMLLEEFLYKSQSQYVKSSLMSADYNSAFLKSPRDAQWMGLLERFSGEASAMEERAREAGIPFVAALVPDRTQAAMISLMGGWPVGFDPYKLSHELRAIIESHGGIYVDILPFFRALPNPQSDYFPIDGHPNAAGHATISRLLAAGLGNDAIPGLSFPAKPDVQLKQSE